MTTTVRWSGRRGGLALRVPVGAPPAAPTGTAPHPLPAGAGRLRWGLVFAAFVAFTGVVISARFQLGQPLVIAGAVGLLFQTGRLRVGTVTPLLALWTAWCALGFVTSDYPDEVYDGVEQLAKLCVITLVGVNALRTRPQIRAFSAFVVFAFLLYPARGALLNWITGAYVARGGRAVWNGVYSNPNDLAAVALLMLTIAVGLAAGERTRLRTLAAVGAAGFIAFIIFITQSRGVLVALAVFVLTLIWRAPGRQRVRIAAAVAAAGLVIGVFAPASVWDRLAGLRNIGNTENLREVDLEGSAEQRYEIWRVARSIVADHPVFGVGVNAYGSAHQLTAARPEFSAFAGGARDTHSTYLNVAAETGVPGLALFAAIVAATFRYAERARRRALAWDGTGAQELLILELGLGAYLLAGLWGSYAKLNVLYIFLVLLWCAARALDDERAASAPPPSGR